MVHKIKKHPANLTTFIPTQAYQLDRREITLSEAQQRRSATQLCLALRECTLYFIPYLKLLLNGWYGFTVLS